MNEATIKISLLGNSRKIFRQICKTKKQLQSNSSLMELNNSEKNETNVLSFKSGSSKNVFEEDEALDITPNISTELHYCDHCENTTEYALQKKISRDTEPRHLSGDFLESMLFPHLKKKNKKTTVLGVELKRSKTSSDLIKELFIPAPSPLNVKLFGGHTAVEMERERSRNSGYIIHPCSKLR